jgi:Flagellar hook-length control protein FliK
MSIVITPHIQPAAAQAATAAPVVLQPGSVISARVTQILTSDTVRITIGNQSLDVQSQVPLQAGQTLQLAVSQTPDGTVRLAVVGPQDGAAASQAPTDAASASATPDSVTLAPAAAASIAPQTTPVVVTSQLTAQEALAVSVAAQNAATLQTGLAPLFANLAVAAGLQNLPPQVLQAVAQVLAQQTSLDQGLTGNDIKQAFQSSGLFLEASLATGSLPSSTAAPDLKAALIVLRQVLTTSLNGAPAPQNALPTGALGTTLSAAAQAGVTPTASVVQPATTLAAATVPPSAASIVVAQGTPAAALVIEQGALTPAMVLSQPVMSGVQGTPITASPALAPLLATETATSAASLLGAAAANAENVLNAGIASQIILPPSTTADAAARAAASSATLSLLQEAIQASPLTTLANPSGLVFENNQMLALVPAVGGARPSMVDEAEFAHTNVPPPPISGALPAAQPVLPATLVSNSPAESAMHRLLADTDAAIARQTLLQVASLPDRVDTAGPRVHPGGPRWNFEIPFATPQGTAMAQFEISRDGGGNEVEAAKRVWRARFSLDVEPAGPVHALVSLVGDKTSVRMWAERPATAAQLRAGAAQLSQALSKAELHPGDIVIRDGAPPQPAPARAGHFLDRAL